MKKLFFLLIPLVFLGSGCAVNKQVPTTTQTGAEERILDLSNRGLTKIPDYVFTKISLEQLNLSGNKLTGAPQAEIGKLQNLHILNLSNNQLTGLPAELGQLKKLELLNVANNQLTGLPSELGELTQLKTFDLSGNKYSAQDLDHITSKLTSTAIGR